MPRPHRFKESSSSPQPTDLLTRTFYADEQIEERMAELRKSIVKLRQNWDTDRGRMAQLLQLWLEAQAEQNPSESDWPLVLDRWRAILAVDRNWADLQDADNDEETALAADRPTDLTQRFAVLREYTDEKSYPLVFGRVLQAMRKGDNSLIDLLVYLIELINIDMFNYTLSGLAPSCETEVYRGLSFSNSDWHSYRKLLDEPIAKRYVAVPLALSSSSRSRSVALKFMLKDAAESSAESASLTENQPSEPKVPCLQVVHVIGVPDRLMEHYRQRFPQSVVSTICAVDVTDVSVHPEEEEVLLRGAFFQLLSIQDRQEIVLSPDGPGESSNAQPSQSVTASVLDFLMVNANRDHLSNGRLGDQDAPARALFAAIVRVARYEFCQRFCRQRGLVADEAQYSAALDQAESELQRLLQH